MTPSTTDSFIHESSNLRVLTRTMDDDSFAIFTACSVNYLSKAVAMCLSALDHEPHASLIVVLVDAKRNVQLYDSRIRIIWAENLNFPDYLKCAFKYSIIEFNTALKPFAALHLLASYERVIYLDPDTCVFSPLTTVHAGLDVYAAVFTPHALSHYEGDGRPSDLDLLRFGAYNLGFFAVRRSESALAMLRWWHARCHQACFYEPQLGLGVDQKWIDLAFSFFDGMGILRDPGLNVAFWNLHERQISNTNVGWRVNNKTVLRFVHFSSFVESDEQAVADKQTRYPAGSRQDFALAGRFYRGYLQRAKALVAVADLGYRYGSFENGDAISPALRRFYAISNSPNIKAAENPFTSNGSVHLFAQENRLISPKQAATTHANFKVQVKYPRQQKLITSTFRVALRLLGPDRYFNLIRYLAHYSSVLNQGDLLRK
jgi:hypothetical protein